MKSGFQKGLVVIIWAVVLFQLARAALFVAANPLPFDADEANHASRGLSVYEAIREGHGLWEAIRGQAFYPPLYSIVVASAYIVSGGPGITAARLGSLAPLLAGLVMLWLAVMKAGASFLKADLALSRAASLFAVLLAASSPLILANSVLSMPEALGFCLSAALLLFTVGVDVEGQPAAAARLWVSLAVLAGLLGLTKYAYAFFTVPALSAALFLWRPHGRLSLRSLTVFFVHFRSDGPALVHCLAPRKHLVLSIRA